MKVFIGGLGALATCVSVVPTTASAAELPSTINSSMTLTAAASPYTGGTTIESGVTVTVEPGAEVRLGNGDSIVVNGTLKAEGTAKEQILFTAQTEGGFFNWTGLVFNSGSGASVLNHAEVRYAGRYESAIVINKASPTIENSTIRNSGYFGISIPEGGSPEIAHNAILNCSATAIYYAASGGASGEVRIHDNLIEGNGGGISVGEGGPIVGATMGGNTIKGNKGTAVFYSGDDIPADLDENTLSENTRNAIWLTGTIKGSVTWTDHGYPFVISNGSLDVDSEATLSLGPGLTIKSDSWWNLTVDGTLNADGTAEQPVLFTALEGSGAGQWPGLVFNSGSGSSTLDHAEVTKAGKSGAPAIAINKASPTIENSTIRNSGYFGISIPEGGSPEIAHNAILNCSATAINYNSAGGASGEVRIHDNLIEGNNGGISVGTNESIVGATVGDNTIKDNSGTALFYAGADIPSDLDENTLSGNSSNAIWLSGTIKNSATWTDHGYPFIIDNGSLYVGSGATLSLGSGFTIKSNSWWSITVDGTLNSEGTAKDPVVFTSNTVYNWPGLVFDSGSGASVLDHAEVRRAGPSYGSAITIDNASPTISHSTIKGSYYYGIFVKHGGAPDIDSNRIEGSGSSGILYGDTEGNAGEINIHDNVLERNGGSAALFVGSGSAISVGSLSGNTLRENGSLEAIYFSGGEVPPDLTDNKLVSNEENNIDVSGTVVQSGTWADPGGPISVGSLTVESGATLTVEPGVAFEGGAFTIDGTLNAEGTKEEPVLFDPSGGSQWAGLTFESGSGSSVLNYVEVVKGGYYSSGKAITINGASPTIINSTIRESSYDGIYVLSGSPTIEGNRFRKDPRALIYEGEGKLSAPNNDWGCETGEPQPTGCGDEVGSNVMWKPATTLPELPQRCIPGSSQPGSSLNCLLFRYEPEMRYDNQESYLANSAAEITDNWGDESSLWDETASGAYTNRLIGPPVEGPYGEEEHDLAYSRPGSGGFRLTLDALGASYPGSEAATSSDWLDEVEHGEENYVEDDHKLVARGYLNRAYGRVIKSGTGKIWLQYWYFYYYNSLDIEGFGLHEGDWEEVQVGLDEEEKPDVVVFSEHKGGASCGLGEFEQSEGGAPVVYVALDSHANYPQPGEYELPGGWGPFSVPGHDHANGAGPAVKPAIEVLGKELPSWLEWPGHWGNSRAKGEIPGEESSPTGPKEHDSWDPEYFAEGAHECLSTYEGPDEWGERSTRSVSSDVASPTINPVEFKGRHPVISYRLPDGGQKESGSRLILSIKEKGSRLPPLTKVVTKTKARGETVLPFKLNPDRDVVVLASVLDRQGHRSPVIRRVQPSG